VALTVAPPTLEKLGGVLLVQTCDLNPATPKPPVEVNDHVDFLLSRRLRVALL
jgi:hypothetical protein